MASGQLCTALRRNAMGAAGKSAQTPLRLGLRVGTWHCSAVQEAKENSNLTQDWVSNSLYGN